MNARSVTEIAEMRTHLVTLNESQIVIIYEGRHDIRIHVQYPVHQKYFATLNLSAYQILFFVIQCAFYTGNSIIVRN